MMISFAPVRRSGAGQYCACCGPAVSQYRPRLRPLTQMSPFVRPRVSKYVSLDRRTSDVELTATKHRHARQVSLVLCNACWLVRQRADITRFQAQAFSAPVPRHRRNIANPFRVSLRAKVNSAYVLHQELQLAP